MSIYKATADRRIKKRGRVYWARFMKRGVYVQESLNTESFQIAKSMVDEIERSILLGVHWRKEKELFDTAWDEFLEDKAKGNKTKIARDRTLIEYINFGDRYFLPHFKDMCLADVDESAWEQFVKAVREQNPTLIFFNMRKYLGGFLSWAEKKGKIQKKPDLYNPDAKADLDSDEEAGPGKIYSEAELVKMYRWADSYSNAFSLYVLMAGEMGMRSSEITQLKKDRIDWGCGVIRLRPIDTKNKESRVVPIPPHLMTKVEAQVADYPNSKFLFPNFRYTEGDRPMDRTGFKKPWTSLREQVEVEGRFHDLKHTFITRALAKGLNPVIVSKVVGTSILVIEKVYLHLKDEDLVSEISKMAQGEHLVQN